MATGVCLTKEQVSKMSGRCEKRGSHATCKKHLENRTGPQKPSESQKLPDIATLVCGGDRSRYHIQWAFLEDPEGQSWFLNAAYCLHGGKEVRFHNPV